MFDAFIVVACRFFTTLDERYTPPQYVGMGIGSSSTQAYGRSAEGNVVVGFDSAAGAKPTKAQKDVRTCVRMCLCFGRSSVCSATALCWPSDCGTPDLPVMVHTTNVR